MSDKKPTFDDILSGEALLRSPKFKRYKTYVAILVVVGSMIWFGYRQFQRVQQLDAQVEQQQQEALESSRRIQNTIENSIYDQLREQGIDVEQN